MAAQSLFNASYRRNADPRIDRCNGGSHGSEQVRAVGVSANENFHLAHVLCARQAIEEGLVLVGKINIVDVPCHSANLERLLGRLEVFSNRILPAPVALGHRLADYRQRKVATGVLL